MDQEFNAERLNEESKIRMDNFKKQFNFIYKKNCEFYEKEESLIYFMERYIEDARKRFNLNNGTHSRKPYVPNEALDKIFVPFIDSIEKHYKN